MISYTVASVIINGLIICILIPKLGSQVHKTEYKLFIVFPIILIVVALSYQFTTTPFPRFIPNNIATLTMIRLVGTFLKLFLAYFLVVYCARFVQTIDKEYQRKIHKLLLIPFFIAVVEALLTPSMHLLFYFDSSFEYHDGSADSVYYVLAGYCYIIGIGILISARKYLGKQNYFTTCVLIMMSMAGMMIQSILHIINFDMFIDSIDCLAMLYILADSDEIINILTKKNQEISSLMKQTIRALTSAIEVKDRYTKGHSGRVAKYSVRIARRLGMDRHDQELIYYAALMHDIGKIGIPIELINKPGKLTVEEYNELKMHTVDGAKITKSITALPQMEQVARWHHERFDGKGYPDGLKGDEIPLIVRIVTIADAYDAMTSNRIYRRAKAEDEVRDEIIAERGRQFDPQLDDIVISMIDNKVISTSA